MGQKWEYFRCLVDPFQIQWKKRAVLSSVSFFGLEFSSLEEDILILSVVLQYNNNSNNNNKKMEISL